MNFPALALILSALLFLPSLSHARGKVSDATASCLECHSGIHPGIVGDWDRSRMARVTPSEAKAADAKARRVSFTEIPNELSDVVVGCAECHTRNSDGHKDSFDHNGFQIHTVVSPRDCAVCHLRQLDPLCLSHVGRRLWCVREGALEHGQEHSGDDGLVGVEDLCSAGTADERVKERGIQNGEKI